MNNRRTVVLFAILSVTSRCGGSSSTSENPNTSAVTFAGPCLSPAQVQEIAEWINSGAKNE